MRRSALLLVGVILFVLGAGTSRAVEGTDNTLHAGLWFIAENGMEMQLDAFTVREVSMSAGPGGPGSYLVSITLSEPAIQAFARLTQANVGKIMRIVLEGRVISAPRIQTVISGGTFVVNLHSREEAETLRAAVEKAAL